ncbi:MAG: cupredoxin domain-containing protein [Vulcanimicrobiaceae bacterium]
MNLKTFLGAMIFVAAGFIAAPVAATAAPIQTVKITAHQWAFAPSVIVVHVGRPVKFLMTSKDVTHGLASTALGIADTPISKGKISTVTFTPKKAGTYRLHCVDFCGMGHGDMVLTVKVVN